VVIFAQRTAQNTAAFAALSSGRASVNGGLPGPSEKLRTPSELNWTVPGYNHQGNKTDFRNEGTWPSATGGKEGELQWHPTNPNRLFESFLTMIAAKDGLTFYDIEEYANRAQFDKSKSYISFADYVVEQLARVHSTRMVEILYKGLEYFNMRRETRPTVTSAAVYCSSLENSSFSVPLEIYDTLRRIEQTCANSHVGNLPSFPDYIKSIGGVLNFTDRDIPGFLSNQNIRLSIS
jgi:hypothetical protein